MKATRESTAVSVVTSVGEEFADVFDQVDVAGPDHTVAEFVIEHTGPRGAAHRDRSREWNFPKQKWNLCALK